MSLDRYLAAIEQVLQDYGVKYNADDVDEIFRQGEMIAAEVVFYQYLEGKTTRKIALRAALKSNSGKGEVLR